MMRREVALVSAYDGSVRAQQLGRLLSAEDWLVSYKTGRQGLDDLDELDPDTLVLFVMTPDSFHSPYVVPWVQRTRPERRAVLNFTHVAPPEFYEETCVFDFAGWRGDRAQLWRSLKRWLEAPHARLDTRVWLKRA